MSATTRTYVDGVPRRIAPGRVLIHNHVEHAKATRCGINGFRAWTDTEPPPEFKPCPCGWSGLPHYHHPKLDSGKCVTAAQVKRTYENPLGA